MSISELAGRIGVSKQAISQFELGESVPKAENMMALIHELRFPKSFFYGESEHYVGNTFFRANATASKKSREMQLNKSYLAGYIFDYLRNYIDFPALNLPTSRNSTIAIGIRCQSKNWQKRPGNIGAWEINL
ncbi:helix-turn-helix transcriptional regulator [Paenibacillus sp. FSL M8-0334]|uniref:helix-turn-helix domain-containing protein n=1 Tax=Paenibacillus sp. FSL M8-0334 TaxID=2921623 RepID=UPI0030F54C59